MGCGGKQNGGLVGVGGVVLKEDVWEFCEFG